MGGCRQEGVVYGREMDSGVGIGERLGKVWRRG